MAMTMKEKKMAIQKKTEATLVLKGNTGHAIAKASWLEGGKVLILNQDRHRIELNKAQFAELMVNSQAIIEDLVEDQ
jgi:hypothetical protein